MFGRPKKLIFLARHPADTAVSFHFHLNNRIPAHLRDIKKLPEGTQGRDVFAHLQDPRVGLDHVISYMNQWIVALEKHPRHIFLRYEDLRSDPLPQLRRIADFLDESFSDAGKVGVWTKADSVTLFDDFNYGAK